MSKAKRQRSLPSIYLDQHIDRTVADAFRPIFRTIEVSQSAHFRGRDEHDFLPELSRENAIFVTSDEEFIDDVLNDEIPHTGIVFIPSQMDLDEKVLFAVIVGGFIQGACSESKSQLHNHVIYPADEGLRSINKGKDELEFSWDWLSQMIEMG